MSCAIFVCIYVASGPQTYNLPPAGMPPVPGPPPGMCVCNVCVCIFNYMYCCDSGRMPPPGMPPGMMGRGMPPPGMPPPGMPPQGPPGMRGNVYNNTRGYV